MRETADNIDAGNTNLTDSEAMDLLGTFTHKRLTKEQACNYLNLRRSRFDDYVRMNLIPKGRKIEGDTSLFWYQDELDDAIEVMKSYNRIN